MNRQFFMKNLWLWKCGKPEIQPKKNINFGELAESEWCEEFETLMRNRILMGAFRYGLIDFARNSNKPKYDRIGSMIKRLEMTRS